MLTLLLTIVGAFGTLIFTVVGAFIASVLYDRFKRPTPFYEFKFEKKIPYESFPPKSSFLDMSITLYLENYISLENYGDTELFNVSTELHFDTKKEQRYYREMGITEKLFHLEIEHLPSPYNLKSTELLTATSKSEVIRERTKTGFFVGSSDMQKLKTLSPIKVTVRYVWDNKRDSDIWLVDFSDEDEVRFRIRPPAIWRRITLFFKRRFL